MSYNASYPAFRYAPVFVKPAGSHPGRALCKHCGRRIPRMEPRIGWHSRYYCIPCWYFEGQGKEFLETLLSVLNDEMLVEAGLRVEHEEPANQAGPYNLNDFGVRMLIDQSGFNQGMTYRVEYFRSVARRLEETSNLDEIIGARIINSDGSDWYMTREGRFEVVLLESAPEPEGDPAEPEWVDVTNASELSVGDTVRIKASGGSWGNTGPGAIVTLARVESEGVEVNDRLNHNAWYYAFRDIEVQR